MAFLDESWEMVEKEGGKEGGNMERMGVGMGEDRDVGIREVRQMM